MRAIGLIASLILSTGIVACAEGSSVPEDPPGIVRHDEEGRAQMWGGPKLDEIVSATQFQIALAESANEPVLVFKHSTQCPISARAAARVDAYIDDLGDEAPAIYWLKVIESRPISNQVEATTHVKHESPQLILLEGGKATWSTSHDAITGEAVAAALADESSKYPSERTEPTEP